MDATGATVELVSLHCNLFLWNPGESGIPPRLFVTGPAVSERVDSTEVDDEAEFVVSVEEHDRMGFAIALE